MSSAALILAVRSRGRVQVCGGAGVRVYSKRESALEHPPHFPCPTAPSQLWAATEKGG